MKIKSTLSRNIKAVLVSASLLNLSACGMLGYTYEPTFFAKPKFYNTKETSAIEMPDVPEQEMKTVDFKYKSQAEVLSENNHFTFTDKQRAIAKEQAPSVVVIIPEGKTAVSNEYDLSLISSSLKDAGFVVNKISDKPQDLEKLSVPEQLKLAKTKARYALVISDLSAKPRSEIERLNLHSVPGFTPAKSALKQFLPPEKHRLISYQIPAPGYQANFKARLVKLSTGAIVWIGRYQMNSSDLKEFQITYSADKFTTNEKQVLGRIYNFNNYATTHATKLAQAKQRYESTFVEATTPKDFDEEEDMLKFKKRVKKEYRQAEQNYIHTYEAGLKLPAQKKKVEGSINWKYGYNLAKPYISPSLEALSKPPLVPSQKSHLEQLVDLTVKPVIASILSDGSNTELGDNAVASAGR